MIRPVSAVRRFHPLVGRSFGLPKKLPPPLLQTSERSYVDHARRVNRGFVRIGVHAPTAVFAFVPDVADQWIVPGGNRTWNVDPGGREWEVPGGNREWEVPTEDE